MYRAAVLAVLLAARVAHAEPAPPPPPAHFDDAAALSSFTAALATQRAGRADHPLRVAYFGDSLTADDQITGELRRRLQAELGDGGPGFVFAVPPHPMCEHHAVRRSSRGGWRVYGLSTAVPGDHLLGLGGTAETDDDGEITLAPVATGTAGSIDVDYLAQPHGGAFDVLADQRVIATVATVSDHKRAAFERTSLPEATRRVTLRARGRVRLFGATLEGARGAVVDNLGVISGTVKQLATYDLPDHLKNQLAHRAADLVVVMYGTNEAEWLSPRGPSIEEHEKLMREVLSTIHAAGGACLVISPLDQLDYTAEKMPARASVPAMVEAQRRAAHAAGCAFWDTYAWMGGAGASRGWYRRGWVGNDFQHPTTAGAVRIATALYDGLVSAGQ